MDMNFSQVCRTVEDRGAWHGTVHWVAMSWTRHDLATEQQTILSKLLSRERRIKKKKKKRGRIFMIIEYHSPNTHFLLHAQEDTSPTPLMLSLDIRLTSMVNDINWCDRKRSFKCVCAVPPALEYLSQGAAGPKWLTDTCCMSQPN